MSNVVTWADGFGVWHAKVTQGGTESVNAARELAREAILDELRQRIANLAPDKMATEFVTRLSVDGDRRTLEFVESWPDDERAVTAMATCGTCGESFPDIYPSGRCPFEYDHPQEEEDQEEESITNGWTIAPMAETATTAAGYGATYWRNGAGMVGLWWADFPGLLERMARYTADGELIK